MTKSPAIGIDLGTTYSCVAAWQEGQVEIMINDQGNRMTPSYVAFTDTERLLGDVAKYQAAKNTSNTVYDAKRLIGRKFDDSQLQRDIERWPFKVVNDGGKPKIQVEFKGERKTFAPEEISAMILVKMKETAEFNLGVAVQDAVVTVPAHFNDSQRQATKDAAAIAGLNVLRIINEPTAAALAYGLDRPCEGERNVLIYDLGGGTVDVSILTIDDTAWFEVKATAGDAHLGGQDFDDRLVSYLVGEFRRKCRGDLSPKGLRRLRTEAERVKRTLSTRTVTSIELDGLCEGVDFYTSISRARFEELCSDLFAASLVPVEKVLSAANTPKEAISDIVLVGGSTRIPKIRQILSSFFDKEPLATPVDPDEAVAYGAAVQAAVLSGGCPIPNLLLLDVAPLSLGIETAGGCMTRIIECNTKLPCERSQTFTTSKDNQAAVSIRVFEGEQALTKDNNLLGTFDLTGIPPAPKGMPKIEVTFDLDANGILNVTAKDRSSGISKNITIKNDKGGLSQKELDRMVSDAEQYNDNDKLHRQRLEAGNQLEFCVIRYALTVQEYEEEITAEEKTMVEEKCQDCLDWLDKNSSAEKGTFEEKQKELVETCSLVMSKISKAHYDQTGEKYLEASRISTSPGIPMIEESD